MSASLSSSRPRPACWKCGGRLLSNWGELECLACGAGLTPPTPPPPARACQDCGHVLLASNAGPWCYRCAHPRGAYGTRAEYLARVRSGEGRP
jgi:hypothetical protein